jgi:tetratricopeptide (TPR) repeat protein
MRVADGVSLWGGIFEENSDRVLTLEDALAEKIADAIAPHFSAEGRKRLARRDTENDKAHQLYLQGRYFWNRRTEDGLRRSIRYFQQAIVEDPNSAAAYAGLADAYVLLSPFSVESVRQASPEAKAAARKAVQLDDSLAEAHASMAIISFFYDWKWHEAEQEFRHAISLNQNYAMAHQWYGLNLAAMGRLDEALDQMRRAEELDPLSLIIKTNVGWIYYLRHDYDDATAAYRRALDQDPYFARARTRLGITYIQKHAFADAIRELEESERLAGSDPYVDGLLGYAHALAGDNQAGRRTLNELKERSRREYVPPFSVALLCLALGDQDRGLDWLGRAYGDHDTSMVYAATDPSLDSVRSDARFRDLLVRMRF